MMKMNPHIEQYGRDNLTGKPLEAYLQAFENTDPYRISRRLGLPFDPQQRLFTFAFLGNTYTVRHPDLLVRSADSTDDLFSANAKARILLLRYLLYSSVYLPDGQFKSYREFPSGDLYHQVFEARCIKRLTRSYAEHLDAFRNAAMGIGGVVIPGGDAACELEVFDDLYIRFLLWRADEEFPASGQILFSSNFPSAFSAYDLTEIVEIILGVMQKKVDGPDRLPGSKNGYHD